MRRRCPAVRLAAKRTDKVIGRIIFLIDSIKTIKGIKITGVPNGTKWANIWFVLLNHPYNIKISQIVNAIERVIAMWAVLVKVYGIRPKTLLIRININKILKKIMFL